MVRLRSAALIVAGAVLMGAVCARPVAAGAALGFGPASPTEPGTGTQGGSEPSAAVNADGERLVTWQGGDPVDISRDGYSWSQSTGGHDSSKCVDAIGTRELFDAGDVNIAIDADGHTAYVSSLSFNETDGIGIDIVRGTEQPDGSYSWDIANCHAGEPASDRPWIATGPHHGDLVLYEKDLHLETPVVRVSHDGGQTFGPISPALTDPRYADFAAQVFNGNFAVASDGTIYVPFLVPDPKDEAVGVGSSQSFPVTDVVVAIGKEDPVTHYVTFVDRRIWPPETSFPSTANVAYIFASLALDSSGDPVVVWSQGATAAGPYDVYMSSCSMSCNDMVAEANPVATTFSAPIKVSSGPDDPVAGGSHVFPLVAAGSPGRLAVAWYGTPYTGDPTGGAGGGTLGSSPPPGGEPWRTYVAEATDWQPGSDTAPTFHVADASGHVIHNGDICIGGTLCDLAGAPTCPPLGCGDRSMFDNFGLAIDQAGGALVTWTDQSITGPTNIEIFAACQDSGTSLIAGKPDLRGCAPSKFSLGTPVPEGPSPLLMVAGVAGVVAVGLRVRQRRPARLVK